MASPLQSSPLLVEEEEDSTNNCIATGHSTGTASAISITSHNVPGKQHGDVTKTKTRHDINSCTVNVSADNVQFNSNSSNREDRNIASANGNDDPSIFATEEEGREEALLLGGGNISPGQSSLSIMSSSSHQQQSRHLLCAASCLLPMRS